MKHSKVVRRLIIVGLSAGVAACYELTISQPSFYHVAMTIVASIAWGVIVLAGQNYMK